MKRKWIFPLVLLVLALGIGLRLAANKKKLDAAKQPVDRSAFAFPVNVITTAIAPVEGGFSVPGTLEPDEHARVMVQAQGKLASLTVDLGSRVSKGQVLGSLEVAQKQLELQAAELALEKLRKDDERYRELVAGKAAPEANYDEVHFNYETQKVKVDQIRQQLRDAQRGDGDDEARRVAEAADERDLHHHAQHDGEHQARDHAEEVRPPPEQHERRSEPGGHGAEVGLREVHHPVGAVDERHADGQHRGQHTLHRALHPQPEGHAVEDHLNRENASNGQQRHRSGNTALAPQASHGGGPYNVKRAQRVRS